MSKTRREKRITTRVAEPLHGELERAAAEDGRTLADLVRQWLLDRAVCRAIEREAAAGTETIIQQEAA
jgi:predicted HicB family RNase H-like nuclease